MTGYDKFRFHPETKSKKSPPKLLLVTCLSGLLLMTSAGQTLAQQGTPQPQQAAPVVDLSKTTASESRAARIVRQLTLPPAGQTKPSKADRPSLLARLDAPSKSTSPDRDQFLTRLPFSDTEQDSRATPLRTKGPAPHHTQEATPAEPQRTKYVVKKGDTLAGIFKRQGLSAKTLQRVLDTDRRTARALARIRPGQTLLIERVRATGQLARLTLQDKGRDLISAVLPAKDSASSPSNKTRDAVRLVSHRVRKGETLSSIFKRHGLSAGTLQKVLGKNRKKARSLARLKPGQRLRLELSKSDGQLLTLNLERKGAEPVSVRLAPAPKVSLPAASKTPMLAKAAPEIKKPALAPPTPKREPTTLAADADVDTAAPAPTRHASTGAAVPTAKASGFRTLSHEIKKGETLASIFKRYELTPSKVYQVLHSGQAARSLSRIRPGQELELSFDPDGDLLALAFRKSPVENLIVRRGADGYRAQLEKKAVERRLANVEGVIRSSLFADGHKAGLTDAQVMELAEIFGWDIDFALELQPGDQFRVVYEEQLVEGKKYRNGPILAAEFVNRGKTYQAFRFEHDGQIGYYDAKGRSKRRAFIRTPIRFARISSRFQPRRWHPILGKWKSHKGVDYAAPKGTPAKVTGDGRVIFRGWKRGYGRVVIVQHSRKYRTVYAHLSKFRSKVKKGSRVRQGQVIGYVGSSGWATGPHLHYEFRVNNVQRNPLTVKLPRSLPLPKRQLASFKRQTAPLVRQLASIRAKRMVASSAN